MRLAAALGTALKRGARVVASRESPAACRMIKRAMISGLNSTGVDVADLRVLPAVGQPPPAEDGGLRRRLPRRASARRPGDRRDPLLRAARDPAHAGAAEGDREALHAPGAAPRRPSTTSARSAIRPACARATRRTCSARSTSRRSARAASGSSSTTATRPPRSCCRSLLGPLGVEAVTAHGVRGRRARSRARALREAVGQTKRLVTRDRRRPRRRLRPRGRAALPDRRARPARSRSSRRCSSSCA